MNSSDGYNDLHRLGGDQKEPNVGAGDGQIFSQRRAEDGTAPVCRLIVMRSSALDLLDERHIAPNKSAYGLTHGFISFHIMKERPVSPPIAIDMLNSGLADELPRLVLEHHS